MPSVPFFHFSFTPKWTMFILSAFFILLFVYLGLWQIHRADEKRGMLRTEESLRKARHIIWKSNDTLPLQYQNISIKGQYLDVLILLDNQHYQHKVGFDVLSPMELEDGRVVLVDRGWIEARESRTKLPHIDRLTGRRHIHGSAYYPSQKQWVLGSALEKHENNIVIVELLNTKLLSQVLQKKVYPFIIRLDKKEPNGYVRDWAIVSMPPERHIGYAIQWFAMALVILILFISLNVKRKSAEKNE